MTNNKTERALNYAMSICCRREYPKSDIRKKLATRLDNDEQIEEVLQRLEKEKFIDELRYCHAYAREKSNIAGWGKKKIEFQLRTKSIPSELIRKALDELDEGQTEKRMFEVLSVKWRSLKEDETNRPKLIRFGLSRGYTYGEIQSFFSKKKSML